MCAAISQAVRPDKIIRRLATPAEFDINKIHRIYRYLDGCCWALSALLDSFDICDRCHTLDH
ncbi:MAG: hypothetical protein J2P41_23930 [Blastocatellia bacterium]|nr:hypothetical protein [Blastocatellia bacterium]